MKVHKKLNSFLTLADQPGMPSWPALLGIQAKITINSQNNNQ